MRTEKIRIGVWGLGRAGWGMHCNTELKLHHDCYQIVAGCDLIAARAAKIDALGGKGYTDPAAFLADPNIELVSVATRSADHVDHAEQVLAAGKMVFIEKPLALTYEEARRVTRLDKQYPGKIFIRHNRRFEAAFSHIREIIASGILGDVYEIKLRRHSYQWRDDWQTLYACNGGMLNNWGPHLIDHALRFIESDVVGVWADLRRVTALGDAEDSFRFILRGANRRLVDVEVSGGVAIPGNIYEIYGTRGALICPDEQDIRLRYLAPEEKLPTRAADPGTPDDAWTFDGHASKAKWRRETIMVEPKSGYHINYIYRHLYDAIRLGKPFLIKLDEALEVVRTADRIRKAAEL
jgi:predicted dehydrogenase